MPCRRMHWATFTICANAFADGGGPEPGPGGRNFWHLACAALNAGDECSAPGGREKPPPLGSGKSGTPLDRMQWANSSSCDVKSPGPGGPPVDPDEDDVGDEDRGLAVVVERLAAGPGRRAAVLWGTVVVGPIAATPGLVECPAPHADKPQAASPIAAAARAVNLRDRLYLAALRGLFGLLARLTSSVMTSTATSSPLGLVPWLGAPWWEPREQLC
jgi:hypothetical protein